MKNTIRISLVLIVMSVLSSCLNSEPNKRSLKEDMRDLRKYIIANNIEVSPNESGLYYIEKEKGSKYQIKENDYANITYSLKTVTGQIISQEMNFTSKVSKGSFIEGFYEGLMLMSQKTKSQLIIPSSIAYGNKKAGNIKENTSLIFDLELNTIYNSTIEKDILTKYITDEKISAKAKDSGIIIIPIIKQEGELISVNDNIKVVYSGKLINTTKAFDKNTTENPMVLSGEEKFSQLIPGFSEALKSMKKGEKIKVIIPSDKAYKEGMARNGKYVIPPYATLIFDIEILK